MSTLTMDLPVSRTVQSSIDPLLAQLALAAEAGHEVQFLVAYRNIDWATRSPGDIVYAVRLALMAGAHWVARELALSGARRYPDHTELQIETGCAIIARNIAGNGSRCSMAGY